MGKNAHCFTPPGWRSQTIKVRGDNLEGAIRVMQNILGEEGVFDDMKKHEHALTKRQKRKAKDLAAYRRRLAEENAMRKGKIKSRTKYKKGRNRFSLEDLIKERENW